MGIVCYRCGTWDGQKCSCKDGVTLFHGDCRVILPQLPQVDLVLTDPPYGLQREGWSDCQSNVDLRGWVTDWISKAPLAFFTWTAKQVWEVDTTIGDAAEIFRILVWNKPFVLTNNMANFKWHWEPVIMVGRCGASPPSKPWNLPDVITTMPVNLRSNPESVGHNSQKPLQLILPLLNAATEPQQTVLDPFTGSGTTLVAAKQLGRRAIGIEIEERYVQIAASRLRQSVLEFKE